MRRKRKVPAHVEERVVDGTTTCDACGKDVDKQPLYRDDTVKVEAMIGDVYPEGDHRTAYEIDLCGACFVAKLVPALLAVGLTFRIHDAEHDARQWE